MNLIYQGYIKTEGLLATISHIDFSQLLTLSIPFDEITSLEPLTFLITPNLKTLDLCT